MLGDLGEHWLGSQTQFHSVALACHALWLGAVKCAVRTSPGDVGGCVRPGVCSVGQCPQWACDRALPTFLWVPHATPASGEGQGA